MGIIVVARKCCGMELLKKPLLTIHAKEFSLSKCLRSVQAAISHAKREDKHDEKGHRRGESPVAVGGGGKRMSRMTLLHTSASSLDSILPRQPSAAGLRRSAINRREACKDNGCKGAAASCCISKTVEPVVIMDKLDDNNAEAVAQCSTQIPSDDRYVNVIHNAWRIGDRVVEKKHSNLPPLQSGSWRTCGTWKRRPRTARDHVPNEVEFGHLESRERAGQQ
jgi:hypothetical protein